MIRIIMMKYLKSIHFLAALVLLVSFPGCTGSGNKKDSGKILQVQNSAPKEPVIIGKETNLLLKDLAENGDYVNGRTFPSLIKASAVYDQLGTNILVIDIRSKKEYAAGHIKGSVHQNFSDLPEYFESGMKPFKFERIIIVSADGQEASYTTSLLRLMGYGNVYSLRWGMSGWNSTYAKKGWFAGCSSDFQDQIESQVNQKPKATGLPEIHTGKATGEEIGSARFQQLFSEGLKNVMIDAADVFTNPSEYYIINYDRRDKYEIGHIPGAVRYKPGATLSMVNEMATIHSDKDIVVYCGTGHNSGFVTAYLRLFGYNAHTLKYGNNAFMFDKMVTDRTTLSWLPFTRAQVNNYEVVK